MPDENTLEEPVEGQEVEPEVGRGPEQGIGLCLSGGGYRAMLFHLGSLWRLQEAGLLARVKRISSVSGGSITSAQLGLNWDRLELEGPGALDRFKGLVVTPIRQLAGKTLDAQAIISGALWFGSIGEKVEKAYRKHLYDDATLQDLPDEPRFVINATNVQSGALWRFSKPYMWDWRVGKVPDPEIRLAKAVAASSAFPPVLSPVILELDPDSFEDGTGHDLQFPPYTEEVVLSDGGVYDNLGLETVWKRYETVLVSDAGGKLAPEEEPERDWGRHSIRVLHVIDNQVRSLRRRQTIAAFESGRPGTYWGIRTNIEDYGLPAGDFIPCPHERTLRLAETKTRLKRLPADRQERLINWGYAVTDAALRRHVDDGLSRGRFPYPDRAV